MIGDAVDAILILFKQRMKRVAVAALAGFDNLSFRHALAHPDRLLHRLAIRRASPLRRARRRNSSVRSQEAGSHSQSRRDTMFIVTSLEKAPSSRGAKC